MVLCALTFVNDKRSSAINNALVISLDNEDIMKKRTLLGMIIASITVIPVIAISNGIRKTNAEITQHTHDVRHAANTAKLNQPSADSLSKLPSPVQRYFQFVFRHGIPDYTTMQMQMSGQFRRPQKTELTQRRPSKRPPFMYPVWFFQPTHR